MYGNNVHKYDGPSLKRTHTTLQVVIHLVYQKQFLAIVRTLQRSKFTHLAHRKTV